MKRVYLLIFFILIFLSPEAAGITKWRELRSGLEYTSLNHAAGKIHAFRINSNNYKFNIITAETIGRKSSSVEKMAKKKNALIVINGGFFTPEHDPLGLIINERKIINPLKSTSWWSVFYIKNNRPYIVHTNRFRNDKSITTALQSGPRLLVNGAIPKLKSSFAERSVVCIDRQKRILLIATEDLYINPSELAERIRRSSSKDGLGCKTALNLDGGSSTQVYADIGSFKLDISGIKKVVNGLAVFPK